MILTWVLGFWILPPSVSSAVYQEISYAVVLMHWFLFFGLLFFCPWSKVSMLRELFSRKYATLLVVFGLSAAIFVSHHELEFKTLGDEGLVASVSQNLHYHRSPNYIWRAYSIDGDFSVIDSYPEKRPLSFAVLVSLIHDLTGYRVENAFYLNLFLGLLMIDLIGWLGYQLSGSLGAILGMVLIPSIPLFSYYSHGGGIDIINVAMSLVTLCLGIQWSRHKDNASFMVYLISAGLLCTTRYEAAMFLLPVAFSIVPVVWNDKKWKLPVGAFVIILLLALIPLQQSAFRMNQSFWELDSKPEASGVFGLHYISDNLAHAYAFLFDWGNAYPNSAVVSVLGILSLLILIGAGLIFLLRKRKFSGSEWMLLSFGVGLLMHFFLIMGYFYGQFDSPILHRFALPFYLLLVLASVAILKLMRHRWMQSSWVLLFAIGLMFYSIPTSASHPYENRYIPAKHAKWVREYVKLHPPANYLVIDFNPLLWTTLNVSSINYSRANLMKDRIRFQLEQGAMRDIYVLENFVRDDITGCFKLSSDAPLDSAFDTELITKEVLSPSHMVELRRIISVKKSDAQATKEGNETNPLGVLEHNAEKLYYLNLP